MTSAETHRALEMNDAIDEVRRRTWFYRFDLPDGSHTESYLPEAVRPIHATRLAMLWEALGPVSAHGWAGLRVLDMACHQGFYSVEVAKRGCREMVAVDARPEHLADAELIRRVYALDNMRVAQADLEEVKGAELGEFDVTLMLGLLYHVENPIRLLRLARAVTRQVCVIETQVVPNMTGVVDWGAYTFQRPMKGSFALIDETAETHAPEASTGGICLCPSHEALLWVLRAVGFARVETIAPPAGAYEQHAAGKRVMVAAYVDAAAR